MNAIKNFFSMVFGLVFWVVILGAAWKYVGVPYFKTIDPSTAQMIEVKVVGEKDTLVGKKLILVRTDGVPGEMRDEYTEDALAVIGPVSAYYGTTLYVFKESDSHAAICKTPNPEKIDYTIHCVRFNNDI